MKINPVLSESSNHEKRNERGMTIVLVALSIFLLMAMAALAVDVGILYTARTSAQHAADAAALAGAYTFTLSTNPQPESAQNAAIAVAAKNGVMGQAVTLAPEDVVVDKGLHRVTVTVHRNVGGNPISTFFAGALGINSMGTEAKAVAEAATNGTAAYCVKPVFMPNTLFSNQPTAQAACDAKEVVFDADGNLSAWAQTVSPIGKCVETRPTRPSDASGTLAPGQYFSLDFGSGANTYRCAWGRCLNQCQVDTDIIECKKPYPIKTGDMVGPTSQGVDQLIGDPADRWKGVDEYYIGNSSQITNTSRALAVVPVWDNCTPPGNTIRTGTNGQAVKVAGFLKVFIDGQGKFEAGCLGPTNDGGGGGGGKPDWVKSHVVSQIACGAVAAGGGTGTPSPSTGPFAVPIRLVQVPQ